MPLNGYDISAYQSGLDPAAVPGDFVIIKATGGDGYVNPAWRQQLAAAKAAGKLVGIYHFARDGYTAATAHSEAQWFIRNAGDVLDGTVMVVLDWEGDNETDTGYAKAWLDEVTAATGVKPVIYMSFKTIQAANWAAVANADYGLWEAAYVLGYQRIDGYAIPGGRAAIPYWSSICMWQYTSSGYLPGWGSALDLDVFYGDATTWAAYAAKNGVTLAATGTTTPTTPEDDLSYSQWTPQEKIEHYCDIWGLPKPDGTVGLPGAPLIANRLNGNGAWPETYLGSLQQRIDADINSQVDAALKALPAGQVTLTDAQVADLADKLKAALGPDANIKALAAQLQK
jgi:GH25 family lysozyme M1 (1,4-beta-N-acetylmuramidase)